MNERERDRIANLVRTGRVGPMPDGPILAVFDKAKLADLIEQQATRAILLYDSPKVDLRMDAADALTLAKVLRG